MVESYEALRVAKVVGLGCYGYSLWEKKGESPRLLDTASFRYPLTEEEQEEVVKKLIDFFGLPERFSVTVFVSHHGDYARKEIRFLTENENELVWLWFFYSKEREEDDEDEEYYEEY